MTFVFSALIWSNIVSVGVGMVAFSGFRSIGMINPLAFNTPTRNVQPQNALIVLVAMLRSTWLRRENRSIHTDTACAFDWSER